MVCVLLTYVLSMVPVGRMFMAGWIPCGGWQERTCRLIYLPLLHLTMRVEFIADGMLAYSTALKPLIPKSPSIRKASWWVTERSVYLQEGPGGIHDLQTNPAAQGKTPADLKDAIKRYLDFIRRSRLE
ncbi:hypothetical protein DB346_24005 [Verrucomicrobia bacterium LW23]|nr:hypothetical protein DB346_24005 [Verrucomicrobia bacterium LW23]